jgi:hypothetical protein
VITFGLPIHRRGDVKFCKVSKKPQTAEESLSSGIGDMWLRRVSASSVALVASLLLGCQAVNHSSSSSPIAPSDEILYVVDGSSVTTYAIDPASLQPSALEAPVGLLTASSSLLQFVPAPNDHFLYALWTDNLQKEHLSTYTTDGSGVPQVPSAQTLDVTSLSQLNIHPSGKFAYAMQVEGSYDGPYTSTIYLFHIKQSGAFDPNGQVLGKYGPAVLPTLLYGINPQGTELYLGSDQQSGPEYWERSVNKRSGMLAAQVLLYQAPLQDSTFFGASLIIDYDNSLNTTPPRYVTVLPNTPKPQKYLVQCGSAMLSACGQSSNVQLDPSGQYLFLTDSVAQQVRVGHINLPKHKIEDTGNFLPATAQTPGFAFSPDGKFVYALLASDLSIHIFSFDRTTGTLTEGPTPIPIPSSAGFAPALR